MKRGRVINLPRILCLISMALLALCPNRASADIQIFGPEKYVREAGKPEKTVKTFSVQNLNGEFLLVVQNGEGKRGRASSAVITINGAIVIGPNAFNKQVDVIKKPIVLKQINDLAVELRGQPGTSLVVTILGNGTASSPVGGIRMTPDGFPVNTPTQVTFTAFVPYKSTDPVPTVELERVSPAGNVIALEGAMVDNGELSLGDEIQGDGVFNFRKTYTILQPSNILFRVTVLDAVG